LEEVGWTGFAVVYFDYMNDAGNVYFNWVENSGDMKDSMRNSRNEMTVDGVSDLKLKT